MKRELSEIKDIELLIDTFYSKVLAHAELSSFFSESVKNWEFHKKKFVDYWSYQILFTDTYAGTPLDRHIDVDQKFDKGFTKFHFEEWSRLWEETVSELFFGEKADLAIISGINMAKNIYLKMFVNRRPDYFSTKN